MQPELSPVTKFYVEVFTAEGVPYGPVHVLTTPIVEDELFDDGAREAWEDAWREAVMWGRVKAE